MVDRTATTNRSHSVRDEPGEPVSSGRADTQPLQSVVRLLTTGDVAARFQIPESKVRAEARAGHIAAVRIGQRWRFTEAQIQAYVDQQTTAAVNPYSRSTRSRRRAS